jgi:signal transduction histidine kinase
VHGLAQNNVYAVHQARDASLWAGTLSGGVSHYKDGKFSTFTTADGLASNTISAIIEGADGVMWFATPNGLSKLSGDKWQKFTAKDNLPSDNVNCLFEDSTGTLWIGTAKGVAFLSSGQIKVPPEVPAILRENIFGMAEDKDGSLWITTSGHLVEINRDQLLEGQVVDGPEIREYGLADGLEGVEGVKRHQSVVTDSPEGRIWFSMNHGISMIDPNRLKNSSAPALIHIQSIAADGNPLDLQKNVQISAASQRITFDFAGLSLAVPERVKYRYFLEGFDHQWSEPTAIPEAIYTNLNPGSYRFRVMASNSQGLWNSGEAAVNLVVAPRFWQTWWFRVLCVIAFIFLILILYRLRLHQLTRQLNVRFEERLGERMRIARELHDSMLQGFVSVSMQLDVVIDNLPDDSPAKPRLSRILTSMNDVTIEGRNTVQGLRLTSTNGPIELEQAFSRIRQDIPNQAETDFRIFVEGAPRKLHPIIRDEVYRIGREALLNAFHHSGADKIELVIEYTPKYFRLLIRDNGAGIDPNILHSGRQDHWGLSGMRERADQIGAKFKVLSRPETGTEIELTIPNHIAFEIRPSKNRLRIWRKLFSRRTPGSENDGQEQKK